MMEKHFNSNKPRLIILSDLWGYPDATWTSQYLENLKSTFEINNYDSCKLGQIDPCTYKQENIHRQFVEGGIDLAAQSLYNIEKEEVSVLAFSIGGVIAWKANLLGLKVKDFYAVSSTRLRKETKVPDSKIKLYFGDQDLYQPNPDWYNDKNIDVQIFKNTGHDLYKKYAYIEQISKDIVSIKNHQ